MQSSSKIVYHVSTSDFKKIPNWPIVYQLCQKMILIFTTGMKLKSLGRATLGMRTGDNERFLRYWFEIVQKKFNPNAVSAFDAQQSHSKWFPYNKGGEFRKWYGNTEMVVNWENNGYEIKENTRRKYPELGDNLAWKITSEDKYFTKGIAWSRISSANFGVRICLNNLIFDTNAPMYFPNQENNLLIFSGFLQSKISKYILQVTNPTLTFQVIDISNLPYINFEHINKTIEQIVNNSFMLAKTDWDSFETSWDFQCCPLAVTPKEREEQFTYSFNADARRKSVTLISERYRFYRQKWARDTATMHRLEEENNRIFIEAYGLQDELSPEVPWNEITITCNPWYRYGVGSGQRGVDCGTAADDDEQMPMNDELEARLKTDTIKEFISYAVGCMFGRYSLDKPGLILANQGESLADYLKQIPQPAFTPDEDNVIPVLGEDWFDDDIVSCFNEFLKATFGEEHFIENLAFIEEALGKDVRSYFTKDFYKEHLQRYHNRPIYWLFSSPKGAFSALIYMHRYRPETIGLVLTYLRSHITKVTQRIHALESTIDSADATAGMKSKAMRERAKLLKELQELEDYERDVLYPLSTEKIAIDLDDGVKVNYRKFGDALYKIKGLEAKEE